MFHFCFTEHVDDFAFRAKLGTFFILLVFLVVLTNIGFVGLHIY